MKELLLNEEAQPSLLSSCGVTWLLSRRKYGSIHPPFGHVLKPTVSCHIGMAGFHSAYASPKH